MTGRADLEARFVKRFSPRRFAALLNSSLGLAKAVREELADAVRELVADIPRDTVFLVPMDIEEAEMSVITAPGGKALHRALYQQSRFFKDVTLLTVSSQDGILVHEEVGATRRAEATKADGLDAFNQYVLLHFFPYIRKRINDEAAQERDLKSRESLREVLIDKIGCLREDTE